jgi:hypothetical protein
MMYGLQDDVDGRLKTSSKRDFWPTNNAPTLAWPMFSLRGAQGFLLKSRMHSNRTWRSRRTRRAALCLQVSTMSGRYAGLLAFFLVASSFALNRSLANSRARLKLCLYAAHYWRCWPVNASVMHPCSCSRHHDRREALGGSAGSARISILIVILLRLMFRLERTPSFVRGHGNSCHRKLADCDHRQGKMRHGACGCPHYDVATIAWRIVRLSYSTRP